MEGIASIKKNVEILMRRRDSARAEIDRISEEIADIERKLMEIGNDTLSMSGTEKCNRNKSDICEKIEEVQRIISSMQGGSRVRRKTKKRKSKKRKSRNNTRRRNQYGEK